MKKLKCLLSVALLALTMMSCDAEKIVGEKDLPSTSREFLTTHFPNQKVSFVTEEWNEFEVILTDGTKVSFDKKGVWNDVDCNANAVPQSVINLLPKAVPDYVAANFPNTFIVEVNKENYGYDIDLSNDLEFKFDKSGKILKIDD
jgi:hypothetical protein